MKEQVPHFKVGEKAIISPAVTNLDSWMEGEVIQVEKNTFKGIVISLKTSDGRIFFDEQQYFKKAS